MYVTLAYPYDGHAPDETIKVDDLVGRRLLRDGRARPATKGGVDLDEMSAKELRDYAATVGADVAGLRKKDDLRSAIEARISSTTTVVLPSTQNTEGA